MYFVRCKDSVDHLESYVIDVSPVLRMTSRAVMDVVDRWVDLSIYQ